MTLPLFSENTKTLTAFRQYHDMLQNVGLLYKNLEDHIWKIPQTMNNI